ncbi:MAG: hypothetical protein ACI4B6_06170 [Atopobiaceae bacterium]
MDVTALSQLRSGHLLMAACCALYLAWWGIFFWPKVGGAEAKGPLRAVGVVCILGAVVCGLLGAMRTCGGAGRVTAPRAGLACAGGAVVLYLVLLAVTQTAFHRQPTTELVLFVAWLGMEAFCALALGGSGAGGIAVLVAVLAVLGFAVSLVCYVLYYRLGPLQSFVDGCVPLALIGVISAVIAAGLPV